MSAEFRENWKRLVNKDIDRYVTGQNPDIVRFQDQPLLTTNASGIGGVDVVGSPTVNQILRYDGDNWVPRADAIGSGIIYDTFVVLLPVHVARTQNTLLCNASGNPITVQMPAASGALNQIYYIKKIDDTPNTVTASGVGGELIDGANTQVIIFQYDTIQLISDGLAWYII